MQSKNIIIQKMLENRGYSDDYLFEINNPDHDELKDVDLLVSELKDIRDNNAVITVYPDFDTDGVSAGTCFFAGLAELGFNVRLFVPDPSKGYGINKESIDSLVNMHPDTQVIITCDTGIGCDEAADYCKRLGIRFFVTDHHKQKSIINADVIVDPMRVDETYSHPFICGAFVVYQILQRYADLYCNFFMQDQIRRLCVFAGIGTVSDTMPVLYENRQVVKDAIDICKLIYGDGSDRAVSSIKGCDIYRRSFWGLYSVIKLYEDYGVIKDVNSINEDFFGFYLAPAINAVKRMDGDMTKAFGMFFGNKRSEDAEYLYNLNNQRKFEVTNAISNILSSNCQFAPYIYFSDARPGILGLIAQKLYADTGVPTFVISRNSRPGREYDYSGSGRSPEWYPCITKLENIISVAGHEGAFGCGIKDDAAVQELYDFLSKDVPEEMKHVELVEQKPDCIISTDWKADVGVDVSVFEEYLSEIDTYRPFGKGFTAPVLKLVFRNNDVVSPDGKKQGWEIMGRAKQHLKIHLTNGFDVVCWNQAHMIKQKSQCDTHEVIGSLKYSEYMGVRSIVFDGSLLER